MFCIVRRGGFRESTLPGTEIQEGSVETPLQTVSSGILPVFAETGLHGWTIFSEVMHQEVFNGFAERSMEFSVIFRDQKRVTFVNIFSRNSELCLIL